MRPKSIFIRTYIAIIFLSLLGFFTTLIWSGSVSEDDFHKIGLDMLRIDADYLQLKFAQQPEKSKWADIVAEHVSYFENNIQLFSPEALAEYVKLPEHLHIIYREDPEEQFSPQEDENQWGLFRISKSNYRLLVRPWNDEERIEKFGLAIFSFILPVLIVFMVLGSGMLFLTWRVSRPIHKLAAVVDAFGTRDMAIRAEENYPEPLKGLAKNFNKMADSITRMIRKQRILIGAIPHELRTPLSRARFALDLTRKAKDMAGIRSLIASVDTYVDELQETIDSIALLVRTYEAETVPMRSFQLKPMLMEIDEVLRPLPEGKSLHMDCYQNQCVYGHPELLKRAITNLIVNAIHYGKADTLVSTIIDGDVRVYVDDDGIRIPEEQWQTIFEPFARLDESRSRASGGLGLGLTLVRLIIQKHMGTVSISEAPSGGNRFSLAWPMGQTSTASPIPPFSKGGIKIKVYNCLSMRYN